MVSGFRVLPALALVVGCASGKSAGPEDAETPDAAAVVDAQPIDARPIDAAPPIDATLDAHVATCSEGDLNRSDPATGHCYMLFAAGSQWQNARSNCVALGNGAHMVSVTTAAEQTVVAGLVGTRIVWIGASDALVEGSFTWVTNEPFVYRNWLSGEPNNDSNEDCAELKGNAAGAGWNDNKCDASQGYVCERE